MEKEQRMMKMLVTTGDLSRHLTPNFHYLLNELAGMVDLTVWYEPGSIQEILSHLKIEPDFIFINEFRETNSPKITDLASLSIPYAVLLHDLHYEIEARTRALKEEKVQYIFSLARDKFQQWYPEFWKCFRWLPHHINTNVFKDYNLPKEINYLLMGAVNEKWYPLRVRILETMKDKPGFVYHQHPNYRNFSNEEWATLFIGQNYAREINRSKIFITCGGVYDYPLAKYFEVLACKTLLLAPTSPDIEGLGFIPGIHFIPINKDDFEEKAEYYLNHEKERLEIAQQGYDMVQARHSTTQRAIEFVNMIEEILQ
ncbi:MAG TPA: glycosyltransferase [Syntrophomonadaceae bacterium]|nr:glycosyltransferase [Syntrophomonadaceae bacterium]